MDSFTWLKRLRKWRVQKIVRGRCCTKSSFFSGVRYDNCHFHWPIGDHRYVNIFTEHSFGYRPDTYVIILPRNLQRLCAQDLV
jgi:hypothetical protein